MIFVLGFLLGVVFTIACVDLYTRYILNKRKKELAKRGDDIKGLMDKVKNAFSKVNTVTERLGKVKTIIEQQLVIKARLEFPQRSSMDGRHKNTLVSELQELETQKFDILRSILKDGFDPTITTVNEDGGVEDMKLSVFVNGVDAKNPPASAPEYPLQENLPPNARQVGKFVVYSKGDDDGSGTTH
jgi:hypothetical protein